VEDVTKHFGCFSVHCVVVYIVLVSVFILVLVIVTKISLLRSRESMTYARLHAPAYDVWDSAADANISSIVQQRIYLHSDRLTRPTSRRRVVDRSLRNSIDAQLKARSTAQGAFKNRRRHHQCSMVYGFRTTDLSL